MEIDFSILKDIGIGGICLYFVHVLYKCFTFFIQIWKESTEAINRNTDTHNNMKEVFEVFYENNNEFQKNAMVIMKDTNELVKETHEKVDRMSRRLKGGERNGE